jgi:hypothetical protein
MRSNESEPSVSCHPESCQDLAIFRIFCSQVTSHLLSRSC